MNDILISIIIPIYNVEQFIGQCLDSIYNQDIDESHYEVICINDVSPDSSRDIVLKFQAQHSNLVFIEHKKNLRQGGARNSGLRIAKGKYIWFIDPDDYIEPNVLLKLITHIDSKQIDVLHFNYKRLYTDGRIEDYWIHYDDEVIHTGLQFLEDETFELWWQRSVEVWRKIYKKSFLLDNQLFFEENVMYEDTDWAIYSLLKAQRVVHVDESPYIYRENMNSVTQSKMSPVVLYYKVKLLFRCIRLLKILRTSFKKRIKEYIIYLYKEIFCEYRQLSLKEKLTLIEYCLKNNK